METMNKLNSFLTKLRANENSAYFLKLDLITEFLNFLIDQMQNHAEEVKENYALREEMNEAAAEVYRFNNRNEKNLKTEGLTEEEKTKIDFKNKKMLEMGNSWKNILWTREEIDRELRERQARRKR